jgi:hypothetical protein
VASELVMAPPPDLDSPAREKVCIPKLELGNEILGISFSQGKIYQIAV